MAKHLKENVVEWRMTTFRCGINHLKENFLGLFGDVTREDDRWSSGRCVELVLSRWTTYYRIDSKSLEWIIIIIQLPRAPGVRHPPPPHSKEGMHERLALGAVIWIESKSIASDHDPSRENCHTSLTLHRAPVSPRDPIAQHQPRFSTKSSRLNSTSSSWTSGAVKWYINETNDNRLMITNEILDFSKIFHEISRDWNFRKV